MAMIYCTSCAEQMSEQAVSCPKCGHPNAAAAPQVQIPMMPVKSRVTAGVLSLLVGGLGVHKFYLGKIGLGFLYLIFVWTFIPAIIAFIEGIIYLVQDDKTFSEKQGVRVA